MTDKRDDEEEGEESNVVSFDDKKRERDENTYVCSELASIFVERADNGWVVSGYTEDGDKVVSVFSFDGDSMADVNALYKIADYMGLDIQDD